MVWNSSGSALYSAVERHNSGRNDGAVCGCPSHDAEPKQPQCDPCPQPQCPKCVCTPPQKNSLEALLNDKDFLLLAALMLLLLHEKADKKLILALAFVMFG